MGWYAHGPGNMDYKYGDVVGVAADSGLGTLSMVPRVAALDEEGDFLDADDLEFLGPLQARILELALPWSPVHRFGESGEDLIVAPGEVDAALQAIVEQVKTHAASVIQAVAEAAEDPVIVSELVVSADFFWTLERGDYPRLLHWLNQAVSGQTPITEALLRQGTLGEESFSSLGGRFGWYQPPAELAGVESELDARRHFAFHGLAQALLADEDLVLDQPDDDFQVEAWTADA